MGNTELQISENLTVTAIPHPLHVFLMAGKQVAEGYGVTPDNIRVHKSENSKEFEENKHFTVRNPYSKGGKTSEILWTLRGVMRLGFLIKSESARKFRDWAEDTLFNTVTGNIQLRGDLLKVKAKRQIRLKELEDELINNDKYQEYLELKAEITSSTKELNLMDKNIVNVQLGLFEEDPE